MTDDLLTNGSTAVFFVPAFAIISLHAVLPVPGLLNRQTQLAGTFA